MDEYIIQKYITPKEKTPQIYRVEIGKKDAIQVYLITCNNTK